MKTKAFSLAIVVFLLSAGWSISHAQVTTNITSSGLGTTLNGGVAPCTSSCTITGGTRPGGGPNLFHSFGLFNIGVSDTANFFNDSGLATTNILSRVTGNNPSYIFGTIQTTDFGSANLFLINPAGVIFGSTASLNVGGSFHVSTADYVRFDDPSQLAVDKPRFYADPARSSVLTSFSPDAFGFLNSNPASITVDGASLAVPLGQTISLVGGNRTFTREDTGVMVPSGVTMTGGMLAAPSGQINLASIASSGEVLLPSFAYGSNVNGQSFTSFGTVNISQGSTLDVSDNLFEGDGHAGTVLIRGGQLVLDSSSIYAQTFGDEPGVTTAIDIDMHDSITVSGGSQIFSLAFAGGRSGDIRLAAPEITLTDFSAVASATFANAIAGNVVLAGSNLNVLNGAQVVNITFGDGPGGDITVNASSVVIDGNGLIETDTFGSGRGGDITLNLGQGSLNLNFGTIATSGDLGSGGNITINAGSISLLSADLSSPSVINNFTTGTGSSGNISLNVGTLELQGVGTRINNTTFGDSPTGAIRIAASDSISFSGGGIVVTNFGNPTTTGGNIEITAPALTMNGGFITTSHAGPARSGDIVLDVGTVAVTRGAQISSELNGGSGRGGDIRITSDVVSISGPGSVLDSANFSSDPSGLAGDIHVQARQVVLQDGAAISAQSVGTGNAGNINIMASDSLVMQSSSITTETVQSDGGDIHITVGRLVHLLDSRITTSVQGGLGNGGNITIDPQFVILQNSQILAQAFGGNGGNILIVAGVFFADPFSTISASSTLGISGPVDVQAPVTNLSGTLAPLPAESVQATALLQARCAARFQESQFSSFVQAGRDGLPLEPGGLLPSPLYVESPGSTRLAVVPDVPGLRVGRTFMESDLTLAPIAIGCSS